VDVDVDVDVDLVGKVLRKDQLSRNKLRALEEHKRSLKQLKIRLRPAKQQQQQQRQQQTVTPVVAGINNTNTNDNDIDNAIESSPAAAAPPPPILPANNRQILLEEKKILEETIKRAEAVWKASLVDTQKALYKLASPVTEVAKLKPNGSSSTNDGDNDTKVVAVAVGPAPRVLLPGSNSSCPRTWLGVDVEQAWRQYTFRFFDRYLAVELPRGVAVKSKSSSSSFSITPDRAHELWGCCSAVDDDDNENENDNSDSDSDNHGEDCDYSPLSPVPTATTTTTIAQSSTSCPICEVSAFNNNTDLSLSEANRHQYRRSLVVMLPSWIRLLTQFMPNKSIWGERELPRYTALWSSSNSNSCSGSSANHQHTESSSDVHWMGRLTESSSENNNDDDDNFNYNHNLDNHSSPAATSGVFSLEIVAISAPCVVDAREMQNDLVEELWRYYESLLLLTAGGGNNNGNGNGDGDGNGDDPQQPKTKTKTKSLKRIVVAPSDLRSHEWSRVELHLQLNLDLDCTRTETNNRNSSGSGNTNGSMRTIRLGWVSHWGDAATRACDMSFAGGGVVRAGGKKTSNKNKHKNSSTKAARNTTTKEFVHVIQASIVDDSTWNKILYANSSAVAGDHTDNSGSIQLDGDGDGVASAATNSRQNEKGQFVNVPPVLVPYLIRPLPADSPKIFLQDLVLGGNTSKTKKKEAIFGTIRENAKDSFVTTTHGEEQGASTIRSETYKRVNGGGDASANAHAHNRPRFPPLAPSSLFLPKEQLQQRIRWEKMTCPFDFVFDG